MLSGTINHLRLRGWKVLVLQRDSFERAYTAMTPILPMKQERLPRIRKSDTRRFYKRSRSIFLNIVYKIFL